MSYPPGSGYPPPYGVPPTGYGYFPQRPPSTAPAYLTAVLFLACGAMTLVFALVSWDGTADNQDILAAVVGVVFSGDLTGNVDFAISAAMTVACSTLFFAAILLLTRLGFLRWVLAVIGGIVTAYYLYAVIYLLTHHAAGVMGLVSVALLLWLGATVLAVLPVTGRAMRGGGYRYPPPAPAQPQPYGPGWYRAP
ncbi:MAG: hypothetical protein ACJ72N_13185 [Labedaea sp.]